MTDQRATLKISKKHRDLLNSAAAAADITAREAIEALIETFAAGEIEVVRLVLAKIRK